MGDFPNTTQINKIMGWRNYATTQQTGASFDNPSFPLASADFYAQIFPGGMPLSFRHTFHHRLDNGIAKQPNGPSGDELGRN